VIPIPRKSIQSCAKAHYPRTTGVIKMAYYPGNIYQPDQKEAIQIQEKYDSVFKLYNQVAPRILEGETLSNYERKLAERLQSHAPNCKDFKINEASGSAFNHLAKQIYDDAIREANNPTSFTNRDELREVRKVDQSGRPYSEFFGHPSAWLSQFSPSRKRLVGIRTEGE
jgi:hypothetical protein